MHSRCQLYFTRRWSPVYRYSFGLGKRSGGLSSYSRGGYSAQLADLLARLQALQVKKCCSRAVVLECQVAGVG